MPCPHVVRLMIVRCGAGGRARSASHLFCISVLQTRAVTRPGTYCERRGFHSDFEFFDHLFDTRTWTMPTAIPCLSAPHAHRPRQTHNRSPHLVTGTRTRLSEVR